ncbi:MAG: (4Fe-4S)-binding protein [Vicingaceae bacterium]
MEQKTFKYEKEDLTVNWNPKQCIHSEKCWRGLPEVFKPKEKPWIQLEDSTIDNIIDQVKKCPSGALGYSLKNEKTMNKESAEITIVKKGPLLYTGKVTIKNHDGSTIEKEKAAFCRCGASSSKPFCDGSHKESDFEG